jgi:hypothetical protein
VNNSEVLPSDALEMTKSIGAELGNGLQFSQCSCFAGTVASAPGSSGPEKDNVFLAGTIACASISYPGIAGVQGPSAFGTTDIRKTVSTGAVLE